MKQDPCNRCEKRYTCTHYCRKKSHWLKEKNNEEYYQRIWDKHFKPAKSDKRF